MYSTLAKAKYTKAIEYEKKKTNQEVPLNRKKKKIDKHIQEIDDLNCLQQSLIFYSTLQFLLVLDWACDLTNLLVLALIWCNNWSIFVSFLLLLISVVLS